MYLNMPCVNSPYKSGIRNVGSRDRRLRQGDVTWSRARGVEEVWRRRKNRDIQKFIQLMCGIEFLNIQVHSGTHTEVGTHC